MIRRSRSTSASAFASRFLRRPLLLRVSFGFRLRQPLFDLSLTNDVRKHLCTHLQDKSALDGHCAAAVGAAGLGGGFTERPA